MFKPLKINLPKPLETLRELVGDGRRQLGRAREDIRSIAKEFHGAVSPEVPSRERTSLAGVSDSETLEYQIDHLLDELNLIEVHLSERGRIAGKPCDCIAKSARRIKAYAQETIPIASRQGKETEIYSQMATWAAEMQEIGTEEAVASGGFDERYVTESGSASLLRKSLERMKGECQACGRLEDLKSFLERRRSEGK